MASFKGKGRQQGRDLRRGTKNRRLGFLKLEFLEERALLSTAPWVPTSSNIADVQNGPMANAGQDLINIYEASLTEGTSTLASQFSTILFQGGSVGIDTNWNGSGDFGGYITAMKSLGMNVSATSATYGIVEGFLPVSQLPTVAADPQTLSLHPSYVRTASAFQGTANNEGQQALLANTAAQSFGVTGAGVTVGVISTSVNQFGTGLAGSVQTGDIPAGSGPGGSAVNVIQDFTPNMPLVDTDEGRAMLENIHDIAPGAGLAFATGELGDLSFMQNIEALQSQAGASVIVDDLGSIDDPMFQDGIVAQGINAVVANGATYLSAAGNAADGGYLSQFRSTSATIAGAGGAGTYMNFDPGSGVTTQLPITTSGANAILSMQFDEPYVTQEPMGNARGAVTSQVDFYILDSTGAMVVSGVSNNIATQTPEQDVTIPAAGNYTVVIKLVSGPAPAHVEFADLSDTAVQVSQQFASAGGTFYPTSEGHNATAAAIGVAAVPWWATSPFLNTNPLNAEPFSSWGPALSVFNPDGSRKPTAQLIQTPVVSGPDGGNTSFFPPLSVQPIVTTTVSPNPTVPATPTTPALPGDPVTSTNLLQNLPAFFGTSSAAPNVAAVVALMKQLNPGLTPAAARNALIASALGSPVNGQAPGTWNQVGGFGFVNAQNALTAVNSLRVLTATPANGQTTTLSPGTVTLTFNRPVNFSTLSASDLTFTALPPGVSVAVGAPIAVDNPLDPTIVAFPITITTGLPGLFANGQYAYTLQGSVLGQDGTALIPFSGSFTLLATDGPRITGTSVSGRDINIQFNEGLQPGSVNTGTVELIRAGGVNNTFGGPGNILVNSDPRLQVLYNPVTFTVTIDLSQLPQSELPTDQYEIAVGGVGPVVVTDQAGLPLDGSFSGFFPSGTGVPGSTFVQNLGLETLTPPTVAAVTLDPSADSGIQADANTNDTTPLFDGQVSASFPGTVANLTVLAQFSSLHAGNLNLAPGPNGRGFTGSFDVMTTTDASGHFTIQAPSLFEGYQTVQIVVVGNPDNPPQAGLSSSFDYSFRIDTTSPQITAASLTAGGAALPLTGTNLASISALSLDVIDPMNPASGPLATPTAVLQPALNPATADNLGNYQLINVTTGQDESKFLSSAVFTATDGTFGTGTTPVRNATSDPFTGRIDIGFMAGLPAGNYTLTVHSGATANASGVQDAAGNPLNDTPIEATQDFTFNFSVQSQPVFIQNMALVSTYVPTTSATQPIPNVVGGPRSYFELSSPNTSQQAPAPPTAIIITFSTPLNPTADYSNAVQLIESADGLGAAPDGEFGTLGIGGTGSSGAGFAQVPNTTVSLVDPTGKLPGDPGFAGTELVLQLPAGTSLGADTYQIYMPNSGPTAIFDIFGNQLDGEFLGNLMPSGNNYVATTNFDGYTSSPITATGNYQSPIYEDLIANDISGGVSQNRLNDMSGDGTAGGAFMTGFTVAPAGNVIYARPGYVENPLVPSTLANGTLAQPYPVLAPQATANATNGGNLNAPSNFSNFNEANDLAGIHKFADSAFYAASLLASNGPVVIVALPAIPQVDPVTGAISVPTFALQSATNGSASVPFDTTLVMDPGTVLKLENASLFVQNQGSALQALGSGNNEVVFTSYNDSSIGSGTGPANSTPRGGDWGGIVFRNYDEATNSQQFPVDGTLVGPNGGAAVSGASDVESFLNGAEVLYGGGTVAAFNYSAVMLYNSRPTLTNDDIAIPNGQTQAAQAGLSGDLDSFREDDTARGPLIRQSDVRSYSLNGIWVRPNLLTGLNGVAEQTTAMTYAANPTTLGGNVNYDFSAPLPYLLTSQLIIGEELEAGTGGLTNFVNNRLYIDPGAMVKSNNGAGISVVNNDASINIGSRTYINEFDANPNFVVNPANTATQAEALGDAGVVFTSLYDYNATSPLIPTRVNSANDQVLASGNTANQPDFMNSIGANVVRLSDGTADPIARWGSVGIQSGAVAVVNDANFFYGGGGVNGPDGTLPSQSVLAFITLDTEFETPLNTGASTGGRFNNNTAGTLFSPLAQLGTHAIVTNNNFFDNLDAPMQIEPNGLLAGNPLTPLNSGDPFFYDNLLQRNDIDGMAVKTSFFFTLTGDETSVLRPRETPISNGEVNLTVNSVWNATDLTYVLRGTIVLAGYYDNLSFSTSGLTANAPVPSTVAFGAEQTPDITLTIQSALPGTPLANGMTVPSPGESVLVKVLNDYQPFDSGDLGTYGAQGDTAATGASVDGGAGFIVGVDDGIDPPSTTGSPFVDPGAGSEIRILGIGADTATGQARVPAIITSLKDNSVGVTVRGVQEFSIYNNDPLFNLNPTTNAFYNPKSAPAAGDGGYIYFGGNSLTDMNLEDPRDGSLIDNADISFMNSIQIQSGGIIDTNSNAVTTGGFQTFLDTKLGQTPSTQFNSAMALVISDSHLDSFSQAGVFVHPDSGLALIRDLAALSTPGASLFPVRSTTVKGEGAVLFMYNDTVSNSNIGVLANSDTVSGTESPSPIELVLLSNTFYNNPIAVETNAAAFAPGTNPFNDQVNWLMMDNIFSNSTTAAIQATGQEFGSTAEYNLYFQNGSNLSLLGATGPQLVGNLGAVLGNPEFVNPAAGDFQLMANSAAIDMARSEIGPLPQGDAIFPTVTQILTAVGGIRTDPASLTPPATPGRSDENGGNQTITDPRKQVTLPGTPGATFDNEWIAVLATSPNAIPGPANNAATFSYAPITGALDQLGQLRLSGTNNGGVGSGSQPFFDLGAFEFVQYFPPEVVAFSASTNVQATLADGTTKDIYSPGGIAGVNQQPASIQIKFNEELESSSVSTQSVVLLGSGGDGIFGNGNDVTFSLAGRLSYTDNAAGSILTINTAGLNLPTDEYELVLQGKGGAIIQNLQGNALDGQNTANDDPNGTQQPLPSGTGTPGSNFYLQFTLNTHSPSLVPGSLTLAASSVTGSLPFVTNQNEPSFTGQITDIFPPANPLQGDTVFLDVLDQATGQWVTVGQTTTNATGGFTVTPSSPLPDTLYSVGSSGVLDNTATNLDIARVRIINTAGNASNQFTDPISLFQAEGAATSFIIDTQAPMVTAESPAPGTLASSATISFTVDKSLNPASLNANTIQVISAGPDGLLGTADDVAIPLTNVAFNITPLKTSRLGPETVSFNLPGGLTNNLYEVVLDGTSPAITDVAGNPLNGSGTPGSNFTWQFVIVNSAASHIVFAGPASDVTSMAAAVGSRENPFPTIGQAIAAAGIGDFVAVLPGNYSENVVLKSLVRVLSASLSSTDSSFQPGNALQTVIRAPTTPTPPATQNITVSASNLFSIPGFQTEIGGFTIISPLIGDQAFGSVDPSAIGVSIFNSNILVSANYILDGGTGIGITTQGLNAATPSIEDNVIAGNNNGVILIDAGTGSVQSPIGIINNDIVENQVGIFADVTATSPILADIGNNIFWQNHDLTTSRNGAAVVASTPNKLFLQGNMFSGNGPSQSSPADDTVGVGGSFNPANLGPTPDQAGNFTGNPAFVSAYDPRPGSDGPGEFFQNADFDLTAASAAINAAIPSIAPSVDLLYRSPVPIAGKGFPGTGPASVGAFYFDGVGGIPIGGSFRVASSSLAAGGAALAAGSTVTASQLGNSITVDFSQLVNPNSISPNDLVISGTGVNSANPAHAVSLDWIDSHTVQFMLSGSFNSTGTVSLSIPAGSVQSVFNQPFVGFSDSAQIGSVATTPTPRSTTTPTSGSTTSPTPTPAPVPGSAVTPAPSAAPTGAHKHPKAHKLTLAQKLEKQKLERLAKREKARERAAQKKHHNA